MNVDIDNFHEKKQEIEALELVKKSQYISFDLQFTGIKFQNNERQRNDMFLNDKYQKMAAVASKFNIIQIGLTFIVKNQKEENGYLAYPYNFYVFPRQNFMNDPIISLQAGCAQFNTNQNMDWNRWIKKGINFVKITDMDKFMNPDNRTFKDMFDSIDEINKDYVSHVIQGAQKLKSNQTDYFNFPKFNSYIVKKTVDKYVEEKKLMWKLIINNGQGEDDKIATITVKVMEKCEHQDQHQKRLQKLLGFTLMFQEIWNGNKTFIGHNCLYDILFIYESFVSSLPNEYKNFKEIIGDGRKFYDTKYIASQLTDKDKMFPKGTSLEQIYKFYKNSQFQNSQLKLASGFQSYDLSKQVLHEAGFDSYLTAWVFFQLNSNKTPSLEGRFNIFRSFFYMDIRNYSDGINQDIVCFVVPVASYTTFIPLDELRKMKFSEAKKIRNLLSGEQLTNFVNVCEGLKEIFIYTKQKSFNNLLIKKINKFKKNKDLFGVKSLNQWVRMRSQSKSGAIEKQQNH